MRPERVVVRAPGKINLSLAVGAVDADRYHELVTLFQAVDLYETVTVGPEDPERPGEFVLEVDSAVPGEVPLDESNLAIRAARMLQAHSEIARGASIHIRKQVPVAGGMGGGSADAAATLVALNELWRTDLSAETLHDLGSQLGADVPFPMLGHTALGRGNGSRLTTVLSRSDWSWVLAIPGGHLSTPEVFRRHDELVAAAGRELPEQPALDDRQLRALSSGDVSLLGATLFNDLQAAALSLHPGLEGVIDHLLQEGALGALVSGSGPTIAALAEDESHALELAESLRGTGLVEQAHVARGSAPGATLLESPWCLPEGAPQE